MFKKLPCVKAKIQSEVRQNRQKVREEFSKDMHTPTTELPEKGVPAPSLLKKLRKWGSVDNRAPSSGKLSAAIYYSTNKEWHDLVSETHSLFLSTNLLHFGTCHKARQLEIEVIKMTANLYHGGP